MTTFPLDNGGMTEEDIALASALIDEPEVTFFNKLRAYYKDMDRAERTPRAWIYLHMGLATGIGYRLLNAVGLLALDDPKVKAQIREEMDLNESKKKAN